MCPQWPTGKLACPSGGACCWVGRRSLAAALWWLQGRAWAGGTSMAQPHSTPPCSPCSPHPTPSSTAPLTLNLSDEEEELVFQEGAMMLWVEVRLH